MILITAIFLYRHWTCRLPMHFKYKIEVSVNNVLYILELRVKWVIHFRNGKKKEKKKWCEFFDQKVIFSQMTKDEFEKQIKSLKYDK